MPNTNLKRRDYEKSLWSKQEYFFAICKSIAVVCWLAYFFYRSIFAVIPLLAVGVYFFHMEKKRKRKEAKEELNIQFRECILSVSTSLKAGYAIENAFLESRFDMKQLYGEHSFIYEELENIRRGLVMNITLEEQLLDLSVRSKSEEIYQFVQVFMIAKRSGGNFPKMIETSADMIGNKVIVKQEIAVLLSGRRLELKIMRIMPFGILWYVGLTYPGYFDSLYANLQGIMIMTVCLGIYCIGYVLGENVMSKLQ